MRNFKSKVNKSDGQVMLVASLFFLIISVTTIFALAEPSLRQVRIASQNKETKESFYLSEAGIEDVVYRIKNSMSVGGQNILEINGNTVTTEVITEIDGSKTVTSTSNKNGFIRKIKTALILGEGISFNYGLQIGIGGIEMENNSQVNGNVYSNGNIKGSNGARITGTVYVANFGTIDNTIIGSSGGDAYANTVTNSNIAGNLYCQSGSGNNKPCDTSLPDPTLGQFPISDEDINGWKAQAEAGNVINSSVSLSNGGSSNLGPTKIIGDLTLSNNYTLTIDGTIWVTGKITISNGAIIKLSNSYGSSSGIIISDNQVVISNNASFQGSGTAGSYVMVLSTFVGKKAIKVSNNAGAVIVNAQKGSIDFENNARAKAAIAKTIEMENGAVIDYETGLVNVNFTSGPSGGFDITSWKEIE